MKPRHQRLVAIAAGVTLVAVAVALVLNALQGNVAFFFSPSEVSEKKAPPEKPSASAAWWKRAASSAAPTG